MVIVARVLVVATGCVLLACNEGVISDQAPAAFVSSAAGSAAPNDALEALAGAPSESTREGTAGTEALAPVHAASPVQPVETTPAPSAPVASKPAADSGKAPSAPAATVAAGREEAPAVQPTAAPVVEQQPAQQPLAAAKPAVPAIGTGDIGSPIAGPAPTEKLAGAPYKLVKNWDFGANGNIRGNADLIQEFQFHDQFGTIANGTHYGAVMVAPTADTAITAKGLGLPGDQQPVEDPERPTREWTGSSMLAHVQALDDAQKDVTVSKHNAGCGSFMAKWHLPTGGALLGHDLVWETRVRMPTTKAAYWFALWTAGNKWSKGAEMDVLESFGSPNVKANAFHSDSVGGTNEVDYSNWFGALTKLGVPSEARDLTEWHTWTWVYLKDDTYKVYYDGHEIQHGVIHWTNGGAQGAEKIDMSFLFDFTWGHTDIPDVNVTQPAADFLLTYELDYSRVYMR